MSVNLEQGVSKAFSLLLNKLYASVHALDSITGNRYDLSSYA